MGHGMEKGGGQDYRGYAQHTCMKISLCNRIPCAVGTPSANSNNHVPRIYAMKIFSRLKM